MNRLTGSCLVLLLASTTAGATNLYKWKDANGVTQYTERPPAGANYESRRIDQQAGVAPASTLPKTTTSEPTECITARKNLEVLGGGGPVMQDTDGDGKPDTPLQDEQRQAQKDLAESAVKAYCK